MMEMTALILLNRLSRTLRALSKELLISLYTAHGTMSC